MATYIISRSLASPVTIGAALVSRYKPPLTVDLPALLVGGDDRAFRDVVESALSAAQLLGVVREALAASIGITPPQYSVLITVAHMQEVPTIGAIARHLGVSQPFVTSEVGKLVQLGLLRKLPDPRDRRGVRVAIAPGGKAALARLGPLLRQVNGIIFRSLTRRDFELLRRIGANLARDAGEAVVYLQALKNRA